MRLQVALSHAGCASRRKCAELIRNGKVRVNGKIVIEPGFRVDLSKDRVSCNGREVALQEKKYILLNKPKGVISAVKDTHGRKTIFDLIPKSPYRLYHAGRLDKDTSGLLLITNDGEVAYRLTHPSFECKRVYKVAIRGKLKDATKAKIERGIRLEDRLTSPCEILILEKGIKKTVLKIKLHEGRKRQIRKVFEKVGHPVLRLKRLSFGPLKLQNLRTGAYRALKAPEIEALKAAVGLE